MKRHGLIAAMSLVAACLVLSGCDKPKEKSAEKAQTETTAAAPAATPVADTPASADPVPAMMQVPADVARGKAIFAGTCGA